MFPNIDRLTTVGYNIAVGDPLAASSMADGFMPHPIFALTFNDNATCCGGQYLIADNLAISPATSQQCSFSASTFSASTFKSFQMSLAASAGISSFLPPFAFSVSSSVNGVRGYAQVV